MACSSGSACSAIPSGFLENVPPVSGCTASGPPSAGRARAFFFGGAGVKEFLRTRSCLQVLNPANYLSWGRDALTQTFQTYISKILLLNSSMIAVTDAVLLPGQLIVPSSQDLLMRIEAVTRPPEGTVHMVRVSCFCRSAPSPVSLSPPPPVSCPPLIFPSAMPPFHPIRTRDQEKGGGGEEGRKGG